MGEPSLVDFSHLFFFLFCLYDLTPSSQISTEFVPHDTIKGLLRSHGTGEGWQQVLWEPSLCSGSGSTSTCGLGVGGHLPSHFCNLSLLRVVLEGPGKAVL